MSFKIDLQLSFSLIAEQGERIARQQALIRRLEDAGLPSAGSRALLATLEKLLNGMRARTDAEAYPFEAQETRNMPLETAAFRANVPSFAPMTSDSGAANKEAMGQLPQVKDHLTLSIVVVEDDELLRILAGDAFVDKEFYVVETENALEALQVLEADASHINVVFADIYMPGNIDGVSLARHIRRKWPWVRVILTSGRLKPIDLPEDIIFIAKPYVLHEVVRKILQDIGR